MRNEFRHPEAFASVQLTSERYAALATLAFYAGAASAFLSLPSLPPAVERLFSVGDAFLPFIAVLFYGALGLLLAYWQGSLLSVELLQLVKHSTELPGSVASGVTNYSSAASSPATDPYSFLLEIALAWFFAVTTATAGFALNRLRRAPEEAIIAWLAFTAVLLLRHTAGFPFR